MVTFLSIVQWESSPREAATPRNGSVGCWYLVARFKKPPMAHLDTKCPLSIHEHTPFDIQSIVHEAARE